MIQLAGFDAFAKAFNSVEKDAIWLKHQEKFHAFWEKQILTGLGESISDADIDEVVRILDRNGKGNTAESVAVARAMVAQGAWRRMFRNISKDPRLRGVLTGALETKNAEERAEMIDELYSINEGRHNNLTGPSGNVINAMLAAYDPFENLSIISMKHRHLIIDAFGLDVPADLKNLSIGTRVVVTNRIIVGSFKSAGNSASSQTISTFFYSEGVRSRWEEKFKVKREDKTVNVTVPDDDEPELDPGEDEGPRESIAMQALVAEVGAHMGMKIWLPRGDRSRVLKQWTPPEGVLLEELPLHYDAMAMKTIENIDVLWLNKNTITRAFEVEHTTSIYSGLLRMADLVALIPNIRVALHIVAPTTRREKVFEEIQRPVFSLLEGGALAERCRFVSYDKLKELSQEKSLKHLKPEVLDEYGESAE